MQLDCSKEQMAKYIQKLEDENRRLKKQIEQKERAERIVEGFFQQTVSFVVLLDRNNNYVRVNEAYAKNLSRNVSDFPGHSIAED